MVPLSEYPGLSAVISLMIGFTVYGIAIAFNFLAGASGWTEGEPFKYMSMFLKVAIPAITFIFSGFGVAIFWGRWRQGQLGPSWDFVLGILASAGLILGIVAVVLALNFTPSKGI
jgi:hypothetical protein